MFYLIAPAAKINETTTFGQGEGDEDIIFDEMSDDDIDAVCAVSTSLYHLFLTLHAGLIGAWRVVLVLRLHPN